MTLKKSIAKVYKKAKIRLYVLFVEKCISAKVMRNRTLKSKIATVIETFLKLLSPFAPYLCEELWARLGNPRSIIYEPWPDYVEKYTFRNVIEYVVQINGKVRAKLEIEKGLPEAEIERVVLADPMVQKWTNNKQIAKKVFVPDKLVNLVVR